MKRILLSAVAAMLFISSCSAQGFQGLLNKAKASLPTTTKSSSLSNDDIISGLKEALRVGTDSTTKKLGTVNGFFGDAAIKVLMPPEAAKVESALRSAGQGALVDKAILSMNRAAEDASNSVGTIFFDAITHMTITDGLNILKGSDTAATNYLRTNTTAQLTAQFKPVINTSLQKFDATQYWADVFNAYNKLPFVKPVNPDLVAYVTDRALSGLFFNIGLQEQKIRKDPAAQVTSILKKVFGGS